MTDFYGNITWWGFSPALDLQEIGYGEMCKKLACASADELHVLLVGAGDVRHILKTVANRHRHAKKKLRFYVTEASLELYARDMLLSMVALEKQSNMGLQDKTELFLEIFGNTLIRQQSNQYVEKMAHELIRMVTDFDYLEEKLPMFDLSQLKYKERDFLEGILKFWRNREKNFFDISKCWDVRQRKLLEVRYDTRANVFDWDYNMELIERGGSIVFIGQYKLWRDKGVAFQIREATYDVPNRTLSSGIVFKHEGERYPRRGYWGDMIVSPYIAFGIETEEKSFYKKANKQHLKTSEDISEFNITALFHEMTTGEKYKLPVEEPKVVEKKDTDKEPKLTEITEEEEEDEEDNPKKETESEKTEDSSNQNGKAGKEQAQSTKGDVSGSAKDDNSNDTQKNGPRHTEETDEKEHDHEWLSLDDVKITFLPINCVADLAKKNKYQKLFNVAFFSNSMVHHLKPDINQLFSDKCSVVLETALFMLDIKKDKVKEFAQKISGMASAAGCKPLETCDELQDSYIRFFFER